MNVASSELCRTLQELSGWGGTHFAWYWQQSEAGGFDTSDLAVSCHKRIAGCKSSEPAYDLGYLLLKLPNYQDGYLTIYVQPTGDWEAQYGHSKLNCCADTPEDAACKLVIELFKQNILKREGSI